MPNLKETIQLLVHWLEIFHLKALSETCVVCRHKQLVRATSISRETICFSANKFNGFRLIKVAFILCGYWYQWCQLVSDRGAPARACVNGTQWAQKALFINHLAVKKELGLKHVSREQICFADCKPSSHLSKDRHDGNLERGSSQGIDWWTLMKDDEGGIN